MSVCLNKKPDNQLFYIGQWKLCFSETYNKNRTKKKTQTKHVCNCDTSNKNATEEKLSQMQILDILYTRKMNIIVLIQVKIFCCIFFPLITIKYSVNREPAFGVRGFFIEKSNV